MRGIASTLSNESALDSSSETSFKSTMDNQPIPSDLEEEGLQDVNPLDYIYTDPRPSEYGAAGYPVQYSTQPPVRTKGRGFNPNYNLSAGRPNMNQRQVYQPPEIKDFGLWVLEASNMIPADAIAGNAITREFRESLTSVINLEFKELLLFSKSVVKEAQSMFEYKGMDIWIILQKYLQRAALDSEPQKHLVMMVVLLCERGTNFAKYVSKMSKEGSTMVTQIKNKYNLVSKLDKSKANELTLARVGHCFPLLVCAYMEQCLSPTVSDMAMLKWATNYPKCMKASAFTALIPKNSVSNFTHAHRTTLTIAYLCHQIEFSKVVTKRKDHKSSTAEWIELTYPYAQAGIEAEFLEDAQRLRSLEILGLWDSAQGFFSTPAIKQAADALSRFMPATDS